MKMCGSFRPAVAALAAIGLLPIACGSDEPAAEPARTLDGAAATIYAGSCAEDSSETLVVYSGRSEDLVGPVYDAFECETGTAVEVRYGSSVDLGLLLGEEGDRTEADVYISRSPGPTGYLDGEGLLAKLNDDVLSLVEPVYRGAGGTWVGFTGRQRVMVFNPDGVSADELPASVFDLTAEQWRGRVAVPATNGSFVDWFTVFRARHGNDAAVGWLTGMVANDARYYSNNSSIVEAVGRGEIDAGLVNHYYNYRISAELGGAHRAQNYTFGNDDISSLLIIPAAAVTTTSDNPDDANALVAYLLSEPVQRYFTETTYEYPLASDVEPNAALAPLSRFGAGTVDFDALGNDFGETLRLIETTGIQNR